jgi:chitinase
VVPGPGRLVGYLASWKIGPDYQVSDVPAAMLSHLIYAFASITDTGDCVMASPKSDPANLAALRRVRQKTASLRTLISIGGAGTAKRFSPIAKNSVSRQRFARSCAQFVKANGFDGVDVDWEFPAGREEGGYFADLLTEIRSQLDGQTSLTGERPLLTIAGAAGPAHYLDLDLERIGGIVDWINLMTFAFHGTWSSITNFNAPLFATLADPSSTVQRIVYNTDAAVQAYLAAGVTPSKIVVGVPFFGYGWSGVPDVNHGLYQNSTGTAPGTQAPGVFEYRDLKDHYLARYARYFHDEAKVPWLFNAQTGVMISYDDPESLGIKAEYARDQGLGGNMIWELSTDDHEHSLVSSLDKRRHLPLSTTP